MFMLVDVSMSGLDGREFAERLLAEQAVSVLPGIGFGASTAGFVRLSLAQPISQLRPALDRIETFCAGIGPG